MSYVIKYVHKQINKYDFLSKMSYGTQWHFDSPKLLLWLCVLFYSSFVYTCVCVFLDNQSPLRECRSLRSGASGLPYYCAPLVCVAGVMESLAAWRHCKPKTKIQEELDKLRLSSWLFTLASGPSSNQRKKSLDKWQLGKQVVQSTWKMNPLQSHPQAVPRTPPEGYWGGSRSGQKMLRSKSITFLKNCQKIFGEMH